MLSGCNHQNLELDCITYLMVKDHSFLQSDAAELTGYDHVAL